MDKMEDFGIENDFQYGDDIPPPTPVSPIQKILQNRKLLLIIIGVILALIVIIALIVLGVLLITLLTGGSDDEGTTAWRYGVVVDLGSSGSRIHVFEWSDTDPVQPAPHGGDKETGLYWYTDQKPGVSSFGSNPEGAGASLEPLLNYALTQLNSVHANISATPIFLFATAGLRLLPDNESTAVLESIRKEIKDNYQFLFEDEWATTITGTQEATFDWLSIQQIILIEGYYNSTFSFFDYPEQSESTTVGVIDLGGGSVEISFFPSTSAIGNDPDRLEFSTLTFDNEEYSIYGHSYLGYGHNSARLGLQAILVDQQSNSGTITTINDPCSVVGSVNYFSVGEVNYTLTGTANMEDCISTTQILLNTTNGCPYSNCGLQSVYQPIVEGSNFVGLDDLAAVCLFLEVKPNPVLSEILTKAEEFCSLTWAQLQALYPDVSTADLDKYCFEGIFIYELLTYGYGFDPSSQQILLAETLYGIELSWALGAMTSEVAIFNF